VGREGADLIAACFRAGAARKPLPVAVAMMAVDMADAPFWVAVEQGPRFARGGARGGIGVNARQGEPVW